MGDPIPGAAGADPGDDLIYTMEGPDASSFNFDPASRQISTKEGVTYDHETKPSYSVTIKVDDGNTGNNRTDTVDVAIAIRDVAEPPGTPAAPSVTATSGTDRSLDVSWTAPDNAGRPDIESYDLEYRVGSSGGFKDGPQDVAGTTTVIGNLSPGTSYQVRVRATNDEGDSGWSATGNGRTAGAAPSAGIGSVLVSNLGQNTFDTSQTPSNAQSFTTGSNPHGYRLTGIVFRCFCGGYTAGTVTLRRGSRTGPKVADFTARSLANNDLGLTPRAVTTLSANTTYVIVNGNDFNRRFTWFATDSHAEDRGAAPGWSIANEFERYQTSTSSWETVSSFALQFTVNGEPRASSGAAYGPGLVSNLNRHTTQGRDLDQWDVSHAFRTGSNATGYLLSSIDIGLTGVSTSGNFPTVRLYRGSADGTLVATLTPPASGAVPGRKVYRYATPAGLTLSPDRDYWVYVEGGTSIVRYTYENGEDAGSEAGWSIANKTWRRWRSKIGRPTTGRLSEYLHQDQAMSMRVNGTANPLPAGGAHCDPDDENEIWCATLTVKAENLGLIGIGDGEPLNNSEFTFGVTAYTVTDLTNTGGTLSFKLNPRGLAVFQNQDTFVLLIGTNRLSFADATVGAAQSYDWSADFSWSVNDIVPVKLLHFPRHDATGKPAISGTARVGETLIASAGTIADDNGLPSSYEYQWVQVATDSTETDIEGATSSSYRLTASNSGRKVKVKLSFTDDDGFAEELTSDAYPSADSIAAAPAPTGCKTTDVWCATLAVEELTDDKDDLIGHGYQATPAQGSLSVTTFIHRNVTYTVRTLRTEVGGGFGFGLTPTGQNVFHSAGFRLILDDDGLSLPDALFDTDSDDFLWGGIGLSWPEGDLVTARLVRDRAATGKPAISGTAQAGEALTASAGTIADANGLPGSFTYRWTRIDGGTPSEITGATKRSYTLTAEDVGKKVRLELSYTDGDGFEEKRTSDAFPSSGTVAAGPAPVFYAATVSGTKLVLTYDVALDTGSVPAAGAFEVKVAGSTRTLANTDPVAVRGRKVTLTLSSAATQGEEVTVKYTRPGSNPIGSTLAGVAASFGARDAANITAGNATGKPEIVGSRVQGQQLIARQGTIVDTEQTVWFRRQDVRANLGELRLPVDPGGRVGRDRHRGRDGELLHDGRGRHRHEDQGAGVLRRQGEQPGNADERRVSGGRQEDHPAEAEDAGAGSGHRDRRPGGGPGVDT